MRRDEERRGARCFEIAGGAWSKFIMRFGIHIEKVAKNPQLIIADLVLERCVTTPAFLFGK